MNASASQNLAECHSRLVDTHQLLVANLFASRIQNDEQRWRTLASLATGLAGSGARLPKGVIEPQATDRSID
jgi:hypothetical protein